MYDWFLNTRTFYKKPVYNRGWSPLKVKKLSVLNFLVSEKLRNLFLKQNIFPLDGTENCISFDDMNGIEMILLGKYYHLVHFCRKTFLCFSCIIACFSLIFPINRPLLARKKVKSRCLIKDVRTAFRVILLAI